MLTIQFIALKNESNYFCINIKSKTSETFSLQCPVLQIYYLQNCDGAIASGPSLLRSQCPLTCIETYGCFFSSSCLNPTPNEECQHSTSMLVQSIMIRGPEGHQEIWCISGLFARHSGELITNATQSIQHGVQSFSAQLHSY